MAEGWSHTQPGSFYRGYSVVLLAPGPFPAASPAAADPTLPFGWKTPITPQNALGEPVAQKQGTADCAIAGYNIDDIANQPNARVRSINVSCTNCHKQLMAGTVAPPQDCPK